MTKETTGLTRDILPDGYRIGHYNSTQHFVLYNYGDEFKPAIGLHNRLYKTYTGAVRAAVKHNKERIEHKARYQS